MTLILNEQVPTVTGLTVNAAHVKALGLLDVVVASSTSGVSGCWREAGVGRRTRVARVAHE